jgi:YD repeat-containing protein
MNKVRIQRLIIVTLFGIGVVLLAVVLSDRSARTVEPTRIGITSEQLPKAPGEKDKPKKGMSPDLLNTAERTMIQRTDKTTGRLLQQFTWKKLTPHEQGIYDLIEPQATLYLKANRVIEMHSDTGRFLAPDNYPQSGDFNGHLVLNVYESPENTRPELRPDSPHRLVRIKMDAATFDKTIGEVRSESPVDLYTPSTGQVQFKGKGLKLIYNEVSGRIEYLEIAQGENVRFNPDAEKQKKSPTPTPAPGSEAAQPNTAASVTPADPAAKKAGKPLQFYRVTFERDVKVLQEGRTVRADTLVAFFALDPASMKDTRSPAPGSAPKSSSIDDPQQVAAMMPVIMGRIVNVMPMLLAQATADPAAKAAPKKTIIDDMIPGAKDVVMTWGGKMIMVPVDQPPSELTGPGDQLIRFEGSPATVTDADGRMVCHTIEYTKLTQVLVATGSPAFPLRIISPDLGVIAAPKLTVNLAADNGSFTGPGYLRAVDPVADAAMLAPIKTAAAENAGKNPAKKGDRKSALPVGFRIGWAQALDLTFSRRAPGTKPTGAVAGSSTLTEGGSLESATFRGDVTVEDPKLKMKSRELAARFAPASPGAKNSQLKTIDAAGDVAAKFEDGTLDAQKLHIDTAPDAEGKFQPSRLIADGSAKLTQKTDSLAANHIDATLVQKSAAKNTSGKKKAPSTISATDASPEKLSLDVGLLKARQNVVLTRSDGTVIHADSLDADNPANWAVFTGTPVVITRPGDKTKKGVSGDEFRVLKLRLETIGDPALKRYKAIGEGAGSLVYYEGGAEGKPATRTDVSWTHGMVYDGQSNVVQVTGFVTAENKNDRLRINKIQSNQMTLELIDPALERQLIAPTGSKKGTQTDKSSDKFAIGEGMGGARLRRLVARDNVKLTSGDYVETVTPNGKRLDAITRVYITGPVLVYRTVDNVAEVIGPGAMLVEDYRQAAATKEGTQIEGMKLTGRGKTSFEWSKKLTMDKMRGEINYDGDVHMVHVPQGDDQKYIKLDCQTLTADTANDPGKAPDPTGPSGFGATRLSRVTATGAVQWLSGDHLITAGNLVYDEPSRSLLLVGPSGRKGQFIDLRQGKPANFDNAIYHLDTRTLEVKELNR